jgi:hypothetical protein
LAHYFSVQFEDLEAELAVDAGEGVLVGHRCLSVEDLRVFKSVFIDNLLNSLELSRSAVDGGMAWCDQSQMLQI